MILKEEGSYCLCSKSKGADQLHGYCAADDQLYVLSTADLAIMQKAGYLMTQLIYKICISDMLSPLSSKNDTTSSSDESSVTGLQERLAQPPSQQGDLGREYLSVLLDGTSSL